MLLQELEEQQPDSKPSFAELEAAPGLLSKALRQSALGIRNISLHNLLDQAPLTAPQVRFRCNIRPAT